MIEYEGTNVEFLQRWERCRNANACFAAEKDSFASAISGKAIAELGFPMGNSGFPKGFWLLSNAYSRLAKGFPTLATEISILAKGILGLSNGFSRLSNGILGLSKGKTSFRAQKKVISSGLSQFGRDRGVVPRRSNDAVAACQ
jgi:hypothetical protein